MKRFFIMLLGALAIAMPTSVRAMCLGAGPESYLVADKTSAVADGNDAIIITAHAGCLWEGEWSYSNNDLLRLVVSNANVEPFQQNNGRTAVGFSLTSTTAESKNIQMQVYAEVEWGDPSKGQHWIDMGSPITVNFTAPIVKPQASTNAESAKTSTRIANPTTTTSPVTETPVATASLLKINNNDLSVGKSYEKGESIILTGKATAGSTVKLYIYSEPVIAETRADENGDWQYEISGLESGDHRVEAEVIDNSGKVSEKVELAAFSVVDPVKAENNGQNTSQTNVYIYIIIGFFVVSVAVISTIIIIRKKSRDNSTKNTQQIEQGSE